MHDQNPILLQTKLHRPPITRDLIDRPQLLGLLSDSLTRPLTLVCASAGFGKTTLVSAWLEQMAAGQLTGVASLPFAWLSLDENDSDLNVFVRYFIAALRTIFPEAGAETLMLLHARQQPPLQVLCATLSNEIERLSERFILALDDYHAIRSLEVHDLMNVWARHWPEPLHLVLISRINPSLPLASLRAKGMICEIRTQDLRFTVEETAAYLNQAQFATLSQPTLHLLEERFEGWIAGLHLAALSLRSKNSQEAVLTSLSGGNPIIAGYLVDEVLTLQFPSIQTFLLKTSILDRFCVPLCEAIIGEVDPAWDVRACLDWIERSELFITPLDNRREWYRFHHLFQELLQQRLSAEMASDEIANLHRQASAWFEEQDLYDEALHHALAAGDLDLAARQMNAGLREVINLEDRPTLERWLRLLPEDVIQRNPRLLMVKAWSQQFIWRLDLQAQVLQQVETLLEAEGGAGLPVEEQHILGGQILVLKAQQAYFNNKHLKTIDLCQQALALLPPTWTFVRGGAMLYLGLSMQASGEAQAAERLLLAEYDSYGDNTDAYALLILESLGLIYLNTGQLERTGQISQVLLQGATHRGVAIMKNWGDYFLGMMHYHRNELEAAAKHFTQIVVNRYTAQITAYRDAVAGLALIHQVNGEPSKAWQMLESISRFDLEQRGSEDNRTRALRARLLLMQGDLEGAGLWADAFIDPPPDLLLIWLVEPQVTRAQVLVARGAEADTRLALQILGILDEIADRTHNIRFKIEFLALRALALDAQRETGAANVALMQALDLASLGGFIRVFADLGKPMQKMLRRLVTLEISTETIHGILAAFPEDEDNLVSRANSALPERQPPPGVSTLVEQLTPREIEVLTLLRGPLSIKEIASVLNISHATVKRHTINIYGKLGVNRRWNAVARAEEFNILHSR